MAGPPGQFEQALAHLGAGRTQQARALLTRLAARSPDDPNLSDALRALCTAEGHSAQALFYAQKAVNAAPENAELLARLGAAFSATGQHDAAHAPLKKALDINPANLSAASALVAATFAQGRFADAERHARTARALHPDDADLAVKHAAALLHLGHADSALVIIQAQLFKTPDDATLAEMLCTIANYAHSPTAAAIHAMHANLGRILAAQPAPPVLCPLGSSPRRGPLGTRLRIGILSPDLHEHSVASFARAIFQNLDPAAFELVVFDTGHPGHADTVTALFKSCSAHWHLVYELAPLALAKFIHAKTIDALLDLSGLTAGHRLQALRFRPAPVVITYCGYPATTGCCFFDARLVDTHTDPPGAERHATEPLLRLDPCFLCYTPSHFPTAFTRPSPDSPTTFGSFNALTKLNDPTLALWSRILSSNPDSILILKNRECKSADVREHLVQRCITAGIPAHRLEILSPTATTAQHLACYARIDVALDTFPYHGTTTTCEALCAGVPVISLAGDRHASRVGSSLLNAAACPQWLAHTQADYIRLATEVAASVRSGALDRATLATNVRASPLCNAPRFGAALGAALKALCEKP